MEIIVLQGPNLNLIGLQSAKCGEKVTLDKINTGLRKTAHQKNAEIQLRFLQTHKTEKAISFLQRNRNRAQGLLFAPASWARFEYSLLDTIRITGLPSAQILLEYPYGDIKKEDSVFSDTCSKTLVGHPMSVFNAGLDQLFELLSK